MKGVPFSHGGPGRDFGQAVKWLAQEGLIDDHVRGLWPSD